jgi:hypothetical protein
LATLASFATSYSAKVHLPSDSKKRKYFPIFKKLLGFVTQLSVTPTLTVTTLEAKSRFTPGIYVSNLLMFVIS